LDEKDLSSGDIILLLRMDGTEPMQLWGAGGKIGHVAVFHRDTDGTAYILESTDGNCRPVSGI